MDKVIIKCLLDLTGAMLEENTMGNKGVRTRDGTYKVSKKEKTSIVNQQRKL